MMRVSLTTHHAFDVCGCSKRSRHLAGALRLYLLTQLLRPCYVSRCALAMARYATVSMCMRVPLIGRNEELSCRTGTSVQPHLTMHRAQTDRSLNHVRVGTWIYRGERRCSIPVKQYRHGRPRVFLDKSPARLSRRRSFVSEAHTATSFSLRMANAHAIRRGPASPMHCASRC
jgi:hypothetical protein